jgi:Ca2+-binding RTX toxin-like protein
VLYGGAGSDTLSYASSSRAVTIDLINGISWDGAANDWFGSMENAVGSSLNDTIYGNTGNNVIDGGNGGGDVMYGGAGNDTVSYASSSRAVTIDLTNQISWDGVTNDWFNSMEYVTGSAFNDIIYGNTGANVIMGGAGNDTMWGGASGDWFSAWTGSGADVISDFLTSGAAHDTLVLSLGTAFDTFAEVYAASTQSGVNTIITIDANTSITLQNVTRTSLIANDFYFV